MLYELSHLVNYKIGIMDLEKALSRKSPYLHMKTKKLSNKLKMRMKMRRILLYLLKIWPKIMLLMKNQYLARQITICLINWQRLQLLWVVLRKWQHLPLSMEIFNLNLLLTPPHLLSKRPYCQQFNQVKTMTKKNLKSKKRPNLGLWVQTLLTSTWKMLKTS